MSRIAMIRSIFISWDFILAILLVFTISFFIPDRIPLIIVKEILSVSIAVLSIVFSVYFAALAIVITGGDNDFINFLEKDGSYSHIIWTFKFSLFLLFIALMSSIVLYVIVLPYELAAQSNSGSNPYYYPELIMSGFAILATWALFAAANTTLDAIKYAEYRAEYITIENMSEEELQEYLD